MFCTEAKKASSMIGLSKHRGSLSVLGGIIIHFTLGSLYTWGNMSTYVFSYMREVHKLDHVRYNDAILVISAMFTAQAIFMPIGGIMEKHFGPKKTSFIGCILMSFGVYISQWTMQNFGLFVLSYGFLFGAGLGITYTCPIVCAMKWFPEHKGLMSGIITAGFGGGAIVFTYFQTFYINYLNLKPIYSPYENYTQEKYFNDVDLLTKVPNLIVISAFIYITLQIIGCLLLSNPTSSSSMLTNNLKNDYKTCDLISEVTILNSATQNTNSEKQNLLLLNKNISPTAAVFKAEFWYIWLMFFFNGLAVAYIVSFWKLMCDGNVLSDRSLSLIGSFAGFFNGAGRIIWGKAGDKWNYNYVLVVLTASWGILIVLLTYLRHFGNLYAFLVCINFFCLGGNFSCFPAITAFYFGSKYLGAIYGFIFFSQLVSSILMTLLSQYLYLLIGWIGLSSMIGVCCILNSLIPVFFLKH